MKYLISAVPGPNSIPPKHGEALLNAAKAWIEAKIADGSFESAYLFFGGGGIAIGISESHGQILTNLLEYPLYPFFDWDVKPVLELSESMDKYAGFYKRMAGMMD
ncbi:unnamed protein product [marine sediment metagenome]|uniref:Muconolactone isomerase domain-containing protein n=1 Tax=marine sediment metagenome TaxID=412755 RepID=X1RAA5_9ZZZZ